MKREFWKVTAENGFDIKFRRALCRKEKTAISRAKVQFRLVHGRYPKQIKCELIEI